MLADKTLNGAWQDAYALSGISVGTAILLQNKTDDPLFVFVGASAPAGEQDGIALSPLQQGQLASGAAGCWVKGIHGGPVSIQTDVTFRTNDVSASGGGGSSGAVTIADGAAVALGATTSQAANDDTGTWSVISLLKRGLQNWTALLTRFPVLGQKTASNSMPVVLASDVPSKVDGQPYTQVIDESVAGTTYVCEAPIGTSTGTAGWRIQKIVVASGVTTIKWAGAGAFNQVADDRTSLTYS